MLQGYARLRFVSSKKRKPGAARIRRAHSKVSLKSLADHLGFSPATVSLVLNRSSHADAIPQETKERILAAARKLNYRPNFFARSLRTRRSFTVGVVVPEISEGYTATVLGGIEDYLLEEGYFYFVTSHRHRPDLIDEYPKMFLDRNVDGVIAIDTPWHHAFPVPVATISGHNQAPGVTNIVLDHDCASELALQHLLHLGHREVAFIKGQGFSSDTEVRWKANMEAAMRLGLEVRSKLTVQLEEDSPSPQVGYKAAKKLIHSKVPFTAIFAFNDVSALGAMRALRHSNLHIPEDVSVVGFDDIESAAHSSPELTTVKQPLRKMGRIAAEVVLRGVGESAAKRRAQEIVVEPELIVRQSTAKATRHYAVLKALS
jgi:DNA-binding LacI/PurR family transcriptional regulator